MTDKKKCPDCGARRRYIDFDFGLNDPLTEEAVHRMNSKGDRAKYRGKYVCTKNPDHRAEYGAQR